MTDSRVKKERKPVPRDSWWSLALIDLKLKSKERWPGKTLYEIGILDIDKAQNRVKIHYKGYTYGATNGALALNFNTNSLGEVAFTG